MEGCPRTRRSPTLARFVTSIRRAFRGLAGAFLGSAASTLCFCSSVSCCVGCCAKKTDAQAHTAGNRRTLRQFINGTSTKLALEPVGGLLGLCTYIAP